MRVKNSAGRAGPGGSGPAADAFEPARFRRYSGRWMIARCSYALGRTCWLRLALALLCVLLCGMRRTSAQAQGVLTFKYTPAPRAQVAIWIEDANGQYLATVALTDAVGYRGIGNRPGSSDMNSGYRWPYGRREGVLPIWAHRRAAA